VATVVADVGAVVLACMLVAAVVREWWVGVRVVRLAGEVAASPRPGGLAAALGAAVGDPHMRVLYPRADRGDHVDAHGNDVTMPMQSAGERVTAVGRRGHPLALLVHAVDLQPRRLDRALTPALRLALENERLRAAALAEFREAQRSRMRLVEVATDERRRLERNLHDGVQQGVVSLSLLLNLVERQVAAGPAADAAARASRSTRALLEELRRVARGIYPAVLADSGLADAALDLAESSTGPAVTVDHLPERRCDVLVETTAYAVLAAALEDARARAATTVSMSLTHQRERLVVDVRSDGGPGAAHVVAALQDQVQALGGRLRHPPQTPDVRLELPCES
jgi:signal transduction histidine kinase